MTIEELFGTLQQSTVATWRKHLRTAKYGKHEALDEFYKEMPEKVDALIEAWMGAHGKKVKGYENLLPASNMNTLKYLTELKKVCKNGYELMGDNDELKGLLDDIVNQINSTLYKVKELSESTMVSLSDYINEALNDSIDTIDVVPEQYSDILKDLS
jgi:DNA-binding ferritin-like protein